MKREQTTIRLVAEEKERPKDCIFCDDRRKNGANFCGRCGKQLVNDPIIVRQKFEA